MKGYRSISMSGSPEIEIVIRTEKMGIVMKTEFIYYSIIGHGDGICEAAVMDNHEIERLFVDGRNRTHKELILTWQT